MTILDQLKNDYRYINAYMRYRHCPKAQLIQGDDFFILEDEGWFIPSDMPVQQLIAELKKLNLKSYMFGGIPYEQYEALKPHLSMEWEEICHLYVYEESNIVCEHSLDIRPLTLEDAPLVYEHYSYKEHDDIDYIEAIITKMPTRGIWVNDQLVSWVVQRDEGSIGIMYTLKDHRHMGYAHILTQCIIKEILNRGDIPFVHIAYENAASCKLAEKVGFKRAMTVVWFEGQLL